MVECRHCLNAGSEVSAEAIFTKYFCDGQCCIEFITLVCSKSMITKFYNDTISYKELNNQISISLKDYIAVTEKYKVRIFMYPNLYGSWV
jgi:hypothetical protein